MAEPEHLPGIPLGRVLGIPLYLHPSWFVIFLLITVSLRTPGFMDGLGPEKIVASNNPVNITIPAKNPDAVEKTMVEIGAQRVAANKYLVDVPAPATAEELRLELMKIGNDDHATTPATGPATRPVEPASRPAVRAVLTPGKTISLAELMKSSPDGANGATRQAGQSVVITITNQVGAATSQPARATVHFEIKAK